MPVGVPGELLIGGDEGLARGYLNRPDLHSEKFIPDPFRSTGRVSSRVWFLALFLSLGSLSPDGRAQPADAAIRIAVPNC